jgi:RNA polymerase sigma-70 factor, ECF subfamily
MNAQELERERLDAGTLFREHAPFVANFLARMGVPTQDVPDLVQEVFLVAHRKGGYLRGPARPTTWLAEIALRVASGARRKKRRRPEHLDSVALETMKAADASPAEAAATAEGLRRLQAAIELLDPPRRAVFVLFELEGESCKAIADGLGIPVGTVYSRLHSARRLVIDHCEATARPRSAPARAADIPAEPVRIREDDDAPEPARAACKLAAAVPLVPFDLEAELARFEAAVGQEIAQAEIDLGPSATLEAGTGIGGAALGSGWSKLAGIALAVTAGGVGVYLTYDAAPGQAREHAAEYRERMSEPALQTGDVAFDGGQGVTLAADEATIEAFFVPADAGVELERAPAPASDSPPVERASGERRAVQADASVREAEPPARAESTDELRREMRQLAATRAALTQSPARALALTERARDQFSEPFYRQEWDALHIQALLGLERIGEARTQFESFVARYPNSPFRGQLQRALDDRRAH